MMATDTSMMCHGWDFINSDNDPMDGHNHGTHVAGTIAAATNNNTQVAGVAWHTKLVALKFLADGGWGYTSDAIDAIAYCAAMEIPISNNSWGGGGYSQALKDVISQAGDLGTFILCRGRQQRLRQRLKPSLSIKL